MNATTPAIHPPDRAAQLAAAELHDQIDQVRDAQVALQALEVLVTPAGANDRLTLDVDRRELGALLRCLNRTLREDLERACDTASEHARSLRPPRPQTDFAGL